MHTPAGQWDSQPCPEFIVGFDPHSEYKENKQTAVCQSSRHALVNWTKFRFCALLWREGFNKISVRDGLIVVKVCAVVAFGVGVA